jgi:hypothetical protein
VEKIRLIHSSARVYYHHYPFFLSKLTKEGKASRRKKKARHAVVTTRTQTLLNFCFVYRKNKTHPSHPEQLQQVFSHAKPDRLWKTGCISTGLDVQKTRFSGFRFFCPTSVQHRYNAFPGCPCARKPLTL